MKKTTTLLLCLMLLCVGALHAQQRLVYTINSGWTFDNRQTVDIPHTWNAQDCMDDTPGYFRGTREYTKSVFIDQAQLSKRVLIYFEGANQVTTVYVNGTRVGEHKGGYTRFCFDITPHVTFGADNQFRVVVDNSHQPDIPPLSADFNFYGGIYRDVYLQFVNPVHLSHGDDATSGVYVRSKEVREDLATVHILSLVDNATQEARNIRVQHSIIDSDNRVVATASGKLRLKANTEQTRNEQELKVRNPHLWDVSAPYMYQVKTELIDEKTQEVIDCCVSPLGIRTFAFDPEKGFVLNGKHVKLIGTSRHQDYQNKGNALPDEIHVRDVMELKEVGGNFLRVSHYPQDPVVMEMCDKLGILTSVEIPVVNGVTGSDAFLSNSVQMAKEMIKQNYNHPSVIIWAYMNEVLLRLPQLDSARMETYFKSVYHVASTLETLIRHTDPTRYTMMAYHNAYERYSKCGITELPMIQGWNLYAGWYERDINAFQRTLDRLHGLHPDKILMVTEYGAGADPRLHSYHPEQFDFSQEYAVVYHKHYLNEIQKRPFVAGACVWNLNDFYSETRGDAVPHVNNKGLAGLDRELKDVYLYYQASLSTQPMLQIGNREWKWRAGVAGEGQAQCLQTVPVYTNASQVELIVNGKSIGTKDVADCTAEFRVPFADGRNCIEAVATRNGKTMRDVIYPHFSVVGKRLTQQNFPTKGLNVMLGSNRYYEDREGGVCWIPEQEYSVGSWGYVGGKPYRKGLNLGSDINIEGTEHDPVFQTQRVGIESFKADIPDGQYSVSLYWSELDGKKPAGALLYNLGSGSSAPEQIHQRSFSVTINGVEMLSDHAMSKELIPARPIIRKFIVNVSGGKGLTINFKPTQGNTILNAVRIFKNM